MIPIGSTTDNHRMGTDLSPRIAYERAGSGAPLILVHGLGATRLIWKPQLEPLARERDVIALDMPGFGASPVLEGGTPPTAAAMGIAISDFLAGLGIERPHVAGNSLGGWVALEMAKAGTAASACLISPAGLWQTALGPRSVNTRGVARVGKPIVMAAARHDATRARMLATVVGRPENVPREDGLRLISDWIDAPGYDASNDEMRRHVFADPESVEVPVTIAWGELDRLVRPPSRTRRPPGSRFVVLEGCGHTPNWDEPELITRLLLESSDPASLEDSKAA